MLLKFHQILIPNGSFIHSFIVFIGFTGVFFSQVFPLSFLSLKLNLLKKSFQLLFRQVQRKLRNSLFIKFYIIRLLMRVLCLKSKEKIFHIFSSIVLLKSPSQTELNCIFKKQVLVPEVNNFKLENLSFKSNGLMLMVSKLSLKEL